MEDGKMYDSISQSYDGKGNVVLSFHMAHQRNALTVRLTWEAWQELYLHAFLDACEHEDEVYPI
jgi:hypothetical protein